MPHDSNAAASDHPRPSSRCIRPKFLLQRFAEISVLGLLVVTLLSLPARSYWLSDIFANLRMQILIVGAIALLLSMVLKSFKLIGLAFCCCGIHLFYVVSATLPHSVQVSTSKESLRVMTLNVLTDNPAYDAIGQHVEDFMPDVLVLLEISRDLDTEFKRKYSTTYPHSVSHPQDQGNFGIAVYSRLPFINSSSFRLNEMIDSIQVETQKWTLIATHPLPPMGKRNYLSRNEHLDLIADRISTIKQSDKNRPVILAGDLNLTPWSPVFRDLEKQSGLHRAKTGIGITPTWYAHYGWFPYGLVLDHVLVSEQIACDRYRIGADVGSDHRSVCVDLVWDRSRNKAD